MSTLTLLSCETVTIQNAVTCTANGKILYGASCAGTLSKISTQLTMQGYEDFLETQPETASYPARAGALCQSEADYSLTEMELEELCALAGKYCTEAHQATIAAMKKNLEFARSFKEKPSK